MSDELKAPEAAPAVTETAASPAPRYKVVARPRAAKPEAAAAPAPAKPPPSPEALRLKELEGVLKEHASEASKGLRKEHLKALEEISGGDPVQLLRLVNKLRAAGMLDAGAAAPKAAQTTPSAPAPRPASESSADQAHLARWRSMRDAGLSRQAAAYYAAHELEITRARSAGQN